MDRPYTVKEALKMMRKERGSIVIKDKNYNPAQSRYYEGCCDELHFCIGLLETALKNERMGKK